MVRTPARFDPSAAVRARHSAATLDALAAALLRDDPLADAAAAALAGVPQGFRVLERGLAAGVDAVPEAPHAVRELIAGASTVPSWADLDLAERGGAAFLRAGLAGGLVLGMKSLVMGYASPGGNKPLVFSGRLREQAARRLSETSRFVQAVSRPGGMRPGGEGWAITVKVRVMHAQVRRLIRGSGRWRSDLWGEPINQHDMLATALLFSAALVDGLRTIGYAISDREADELVHLWRIVGVVMGVEEALLPTSFAPALELAHAIRDTQGQPDEDGRALVAALFASRVDGAKSARERWIARRRVAFMHGTCRLLIGDALADALAIPRGSWDPARAVLTRAASVAAQLNRLPFVRELATSLGDKYWDLAVAEGLGDARPSYAPPEDLRGLKRSA
jgi:hypothetical protein